MRIFMVLVSFLLIYLLGAEAINYVAVYRLDMVDPKFGDAEGNLQVGREALRYLAAVATVSFVAGIWPHRAWLPSVSTTLLGVAAMGGACICTIFSLAGLYLASKLPESMSGELWPISWLVLFGSPMLYGRKVFPLIRPQVSRSSP